MSHTAAERPTAQLPEEPTSFVGRATELARLGELLASARLVTVTGPGGVGKTRLALRAAADAEARFPDGVRLVELSALTDPELLANTVSAGLGLTEHAPQPLEQVLDYVRDRELLLILDTCEHLVDACALLAEAILERTEHVTVLATSRQPLLVTGEQEYPLTPLDADAAELFAQRAADAAPGFEITDGNRADITRLCQRLDGIPLAIELAASRLRDIPLTELTERIDGRFLDATGSQDSPVDRHRTLRDAIGWSYALCTPEERALWERLSVFAGPVSADAAQQVCAGGSLNREATLDAVFGLVDKSVLIRTGDNRSRYRMLDTVREYGAERLTATGTASRVRARHLRRYLGMASDLADHPLENQVARYTALRAEHADIRAALEYAVTLPTDTGTGHPALQLPAYLEWYWVACGRHQEARYWLNRGLDLVSEPGPDRARALIARSFVTTLQGDAHQAALDDAREGIALADDIGASLIKARGLACLGMSLLTSNRPEEARTAVRESARLADPTDGRSDVTAYLGIIRAYSNLVSGDLEGSLRACEQTLRLIPPDIGERWVSAPMNSLAGLALTLLGRPDEGNRAALRGVVMNHELGDMTGLVHSLGIVSMVAAAQHRPERTAWLIGATDGLWEKYGAPFVGVEEMQAFTAQAMQEARTALGEDRYDEVVRDARARPLDEIIDVVVGDLDQILALPAGLRP